jgi:hypothetical protein
MGFRGSRVQIPPSRFLSSDATAISCCGVFASQACGRVCVEFLRHSALPQLPRLVHHSEYIGIVGLLVNLQERVDVLLGSSRARWTSRALQPRDATSHVRPFKSTLAVLAQILDEKPVAEVADEHPSADTSALYAWSSVRARGAESARIARCCRDGRAGLSIVSVDRASYARTRASDT